MLWNLYLSKGIVIIPTVSKTVAGFYLETEPVEVVPAQDVDRLDLALKRTIERGTPIVSTPTRAKFPEPVVLKYAKENSLASFEKRASCFSLVKRESVYEINAGVQDLAQTVNATENYVYSAGTNAQEALGLFDGYNGRDANGNSTVNEMTKVQRKSNTDSFNTGFIVGTNGRDGTLHPGALANGDPVFCVIAYNISTGLVQTGFGVHYGGVNEIGAQASGMGQAVKPVSLFIHETAENHFFAAISMSYKY